MEWIVKNRMLIMFCFLGYYCLILVGQGLYKGFDIDVVFGSLSMVLLGLIAAFVEHSILFGKSRKKIEYGLFIPIFIIFLFVVSILGPVLFFFFFTIDYLQIAGLAFIIAGMSMALEFLVPVDEV